MVRRVSPGRRDRCHSCHGLAPGLPDAPIRPVRGYHSRYCGECVPLVGHRAACGREGMRRAAIRGVPEGDVRRAGAAGWAVTSGPNRLKTATNGVVKRYVDASFRLKDARPSASRRLADRLQHAPDSASAGRRIAPSRGRPGTTCAPHHSAGGSGPVAMRTASASPGRPRAAEPGQHPNIPGGPGGPGGPWKV